jgi:hypothetical protein
MRSRRRTALSSGGILQQARSPAAAEPAFDRSDRLLRWLIYSGGKWKVIYFDKK